MMIFNPNYKLPQTRDSLARLARMKKGADRVYRYFDWLNVDYRNRDNKEKHENEISLLREDVKITLYLNDTQDALVNYFIACVLFAIQTTFKDETPRGTACPVDRGLLERMFDAEQVTECLADADYDLISVASGIFLLESTTDPANLSSIALARKGILVMADQELVETVALSTILKIDDNDDPIDDDEEGKLFLDELTRAEEMNRKSFFS